MLAHVSKEHADSTLRRGMHMYAVSYSETLVND